MELNKPELKKLMDDHFKGNYTKLSNAIGVDVAHVYRVLEKGNNCGAKFYSGLMKWCHDNNRDYKNYIFLP